MKTQFQNGTIVTPEFLNAMANAACKKTPSNDGDVKSPSFDELADSDWLTKTILQELYSSLGLNPGDHVGDPISGAILVAVLRAFGTSQPERLSYIEKLVGFINTLHGDPSDFCMQLRGDVDSLKDGAQSLDDRVDTAERAIVNIRTAIPAKVSSWMDAVHTIDVGLAGGNILNDGSGVSLGFGEEASLKVSIPVGAGCRAFIDFSYLAAFGTHGGLSGEFQIYFPFSLDDTPFPAGKWHAGIATLYDRMNSLIRRFDVFLDAPEGGGQTFRFLEQKGGVSESYLTWGSWATACQFFFSGSVPVRPGYIASKTTART